MSSMNEMLQKLTAREKEKFAAEQEVAEQCREAEARVTGASELLQEVARAQEQELKVLRAQQDQRLREESYQAQQSVHRAKDATAAAVYIAEAAEKRQKSAEALVASLQVKLQDLEAHFDSRVQSADDSIAGLQRLMKQRLERLTAQDDCRVAAMTDHALKVHATSGAAVLGNAAELEDQVYRADVRSRTDLFHQHQVIADKLEERLGIAD
jgi:DNA polymerase II small subunit/DNA polymerase delta subunit B